MRQAFIDTLTKHAEKDKKIMLLTGDLGFGVFDDFAKRFPKQFINMGLSEQNMTTVAAGLAKEGYTVFTYSIANFNTLRALEQIRIDVAYHEGNVVIVSTGCGMSYGQLGMTHHATEDLATLRAMPNIKVYAPNDAWEAGEIVKKASTGIGPVYIRLDNTKAENTRAKGEKFELGKIRTLRKGNDVTLVSVGGMTKIALEAAETLAEENIAARVLAVHSLSDFDTKTLLKAVKETEAIVTLEEHVIEGGLAGVVAETCLEQGIVPQKFKRLGLKGFPTVVGDQAYLRGVYGLDTAAVVRAVKKLL